MRTIHKFGLALVTMIVTLVPGIASAADNMVVREMKDLFDILVKFFKPSLIPNEEWWWLYCIIFLPLTFALFRFAPEWMKKVADYIGRGVIIALIIMAIPTAIFFVIGLVVWFVCMFIPFLNRFPKIMRVVAWALRIIIMIGLLRGIATAALKKETYTGLWAKVRGIWDALGKFSVVCQIAGALLIFGLLNRYEIGTIDGFIVPASAISAGMGILASVYFFAFHKKVKDKISLMKTRLTVDGKVPCPYIIEATGKACATPNEVAALNCKACGSPLRYDCECGQKEGKKLSFILDDVCPAPGCGRVTPALPNVAHTMSIPPALHRERKAAAKAAKKGAPRTPAVATLQVVAATAGSTGIDAALSSREDRIWHAVDSSYEDEI